MPHVLAVAYPVTATYASLLTLLAVGLAIRVGLARMHQRDEEFIHRISRAHGNLAENAPLFILLLLLVEGNGARAGILHGFGALFLAARCSHAVGVSRVYAYSAPRRWGIIGTWNLLILLALYLLFLTYT